MAEEAYQRNEENNEGLQDLEILRRYNCDSAIKKLDVDLLANSWKRISYQLDVYTVHNPTMAFSTNGLNNLHYSLI